MNEQLFGIAIGNQLRERGAHTHAPFRMSDQLPAQKGDARAPAARRARGADPLRQLDQPENELLLPTPSRRKLTKLVEPPRCSICPGPTRTHLLVQRSANTGPFSRAQVCRINPGLNSWRWDGSPQVSLRWPLSDGLGRRICGQLWHLTCRRRTRRSGADFSIGRGTHGPPSGRRRTAKSRLSKLARRYNLLITLKY